ncbi:MAG: 4Fe-4S cluster-binding domain-containing protein [Oscillospiraceae bacterium]|nr:4Fe-4S cluster-binding domain-containing protein [Oscillospiraceae bacterium]
MLCPRKCGVDRASGQLGFCRMPAQLRAARAMLHYGEEPPVSGAFGTGAVFFSGCTLRCVYCQNGEISEGGKGIPLVARRLREIFEQLIDEGAQSIDLVTPTHFLPEILPALTPKLPVPVVYNCGGYERVETLRELEGLVDVYLPDFKYADPVLAEKLSRAPDYFEVAAAAIREMYRQVGGAVVTDGIMERGLLIRHLVLPGYLDNSLRVIEWVAANFPKNDVLFSLMSQYVPTGRVAPPLDRRVSAEEYDGAVSWMELCGITNGYTQDASAATMEYLPSFDFSGIL